MVQLIAGQPTKAEKKAARQRMRELEKAALSCLAPGTTTMQERQRIANRKVEAVTDLTMEFLLSVGRVDKKFGERLRAQVLPLLQEWELELDARVCYLGDLRSKPR